MYKNVKNAASTDLLTAEQLAEKLNISKRSVFRFTQEGRIPGQIKIGGAWRYRRIEIEKRLLSGSEFLLSGE